MAGAKADDRVGEAASHPQERRSAEEVQKSEVHRFFFFLSVNLFEQLSWVLGSTLKLI